MLMNPMVPVKRVKPPAQAVKWGIAPRSRSPGSCRAERRSALLKREELGSTGVGNGVAITHVRLEQVRNPFGIMVLRNRLHLGRLMVSSGHSITLTCRKT